MWMAGCADGAVSIIEKRVPHYMSDIQKTKVASIVDKRNLRPLKRRAVLKKKEADALRVQRLEERSELLRNLKTVVVAQDRCVCAQWWHVEILI